MDDIANLPDEGIEEVDLMDDEGGGGGQDLNNSSTSLDKYVGKGRNSKYMTLLPEDFEPGDMDVLCGRGKRCFNSPGNQRFRKLVSARAEDYSAASTRTDKTFIVCSIVAEVRKASPKGGFVKKDSTTGRWYEVGDFNAHEKTSQMFRDVLHESYLSSNKSKKKRRDLFRTNSKRRALMSQQQDNKTINASAGRFIRGNGVARHHSYGSVKRAVGAQQQYNLMNMRTNAMSGQAMSGAQSVHSGHDSWHNSFQSDGFQSDGIKSEPGMMLANNPRLAYGSRRQNSMGELQMQGDFDDSFGGPQDFHNSFGEFNLTDLNMVQNNNGGNNFHNSCVGRLGADNSNARKTQLSPHEFHNSFGEYHTNTNLLMNNNANNGDFNIPQDDMDLHNSFGEMQMRNRAKSPFGGSGGGHHPGYRNGNNYSPHPDLEPQYALDADSVPLSISVPEGAPSSGNGMQAEPFQLEFETDENSSSHHRMRGRMPVISQQQQQPQLQMAQQTQMAQGLESPREMGDMSLLDALEGAYSGQQQQQGGDDNPFEPVPLPNVQPDGVFQL